MTKLAKLNFSKAETPKGGVAVILAGSDLSLGSVAAEVVSGLEGGLQRSAGIAGFTGKKKASVDLVAPAGSGLDRLIVFGVGDAGELTGDDWRAFGGAVFAELQKTKADAATCFWMSRAMQIRPVYWRQSSQWA